MASVKRTTVNTYEIAFSEKEIEEIVRAHVVATHGREWSNAQISIWQQTAQVVMGDIDDRYETVGRAKLVVVDGEV